MPLVYELADDSVEKLSILMKPSEVDASKASLTLSWGPHRLTQKVRIRLSP